MPFTLSVVGADDLCMDSQVVNLLEEVSEFPSSIYDDPAKLAELKIISKSYLEARIGKSILWKTITDELLDGNGKFTLYPKRSPILLVTSLVVADGQNANPQTLIENTDFWGYTDHLMLLKPTFPGHKNVTISYHAGIASTVGIETSMAIARTAALHVLVTLTSGSNKSSGIQAGPISLRELFFKGGKYVSKRTELIDKVEEWIRTKSGVRMAVVGGDQEPDALWGHILGDTAQKTYRPREDVYE